MASSNRHILELLHRWDEAATQLRIRVIRLLCRMVATLSLDASNISCLFLRPPRLQYGPSMVVGLGTANPKLRAVLRMNTDKLRWNLCSPSDAVCDECLLDLLPNAHDGAGVVTLLQQGVHVHNDFHTAKVRHGNCSCERFRQDPFVEGPQTAKPAAGVCNFCKLCSASAHVLLQQPRYRKSAK